VAELKKTGYRPRSFYEADTELRDVIDQIGGGHFSAGEPGLFQPLVDSLLNWDEYMLMADYRAYVDCQDRVSRAYADQEQWTRMSVLNVARIGYFSSDRTIREYCRDIWGVSLRSDPTRGDDQGGAVDGERQHERRGSARGEILR
jgi:starch phosphorylase